MNRSAPKKLQDRSVIRKQAAAYREKEWPVRPMEYSRAACFAWYLIYRTTHIKLPRGLHGLHDYFSGFALFFVQEMPFPLEMDRILLIRDLVQFWESGNNWGDFQWKERGIKE